MESHQEQILNREEKAIGTIETGYTRSEIRKSLPKRMMRLQQRSNTWALRNKRVMWASETAIEDKGKDDAPTNNSQQTKERV